MLPKDIVKMVRRIEIRTNRLVNDVFSGQYHSVFKGKGMEFVDVREYQAGDDIRTIDWNVTARMGHPYVKTFEEERELTVMLLVDLSGSQSFGTVERFKVQMAAEISALLAFSAIKNNDKVGLLAFTDRVERFIPPKKGTQHVLRVIRELLYYKPKHKGTNVDAALSYFGRVMKRRSIAFLISDFYSPGFEKSLRVANKKHDVVALVLSDPREYSLPRVGYLRLKDAETGREFVINTSVKTLMSEFERGAVRRRDRLANTFRSTGVDFIELSTDRPYSAALIKFFRARARRYR
jgi:uncharacterized protein (DUF58 family)